MLPSQCDGKDLMNGARNKILSKPNCRCLKLAKAQPSLEEFVINSDANIYSPNGIMTLLQRATVRIINPHSSMLDLHSTLSHVNLLDSSRLRPSWDSYFMYLADLAARRSNCMKRRVGCVLVRGARVISTGYNGTPRGVRNCNEGGCPRCNIGEGSGQSLSTCLCMHAEVCFLYFIFDCRKMLFWKLVRKELERGEYYIAIRNPD